MNSPQDKLRATATTTDSAATSEAFMAGESSQPGVQVNSQGAFVRASNQERLGAVEEDSTDVFLLTRCSPLNDF